MNVSNLLSMLRIVLTFPTAYYIYSGSYKTAVIIGIIAGITDFLDGFLARKLNQITDLGKILDPVADKIFVGVIALVMLITELIPLWFFIALILRDALILAGGYYVSKKTNIVLQSNFEGKATFFLIVLTMLGILLEQEYAYRYGFLLCAAAMLYSFGSYLIRMAQVLGERKR